MNRPNEAFEELGLKVQRAQYQMEQVRGIGTARGVRVTVDAENHLLSVDAPDGAAVLEAYEAALRDKQPKVEAAMREINNDASFQSVLIFSEANSARLERERIQRQEDAESERYSANASRQWSVYDDS